MKKSNMRRTIQFNHQLPLLLMLFSLAFTTQSCDQKEKEIKKETISTIEKLEHFLLRPELEKGYGYSHAVKIGDNIKISGAVSIDD